MTKIISIALTGHRPNKLGGYNMEQPSYQKLQQHLQQIIVKQFDVFDIVVGHSGLALGADTVWTKAILAVKEQHPERVVFHAEIPCMEQSQPWFKQSDIDFWQHSVTSADLATVYGSLAEIPNVKDPKRIKLASQLLKERNVGMMSHADWVLAIHDGTPGGTSHAVKYCNDKSIPVHTIDPKLFF